MGNTVTNVKVVIDGKTAGKSLADLQQLAASLKNELSETTAGTDAFVKKSAELQRVTNAVTALEKKYQSLKEKAGGELDTIIAKQENLRDRIAKTLNPTEKQKLINELAEVNKQFSEMSRITQGIAQGNSIAQLRQQQALLRQEIENSTDSVEELNKKYAQFNDISAKIDAHNAKLKGVSSAISEANAPQGIGTVTSIAAGGVVAAAALEASNSIALLKDETIKYQQALSELSAITGLSGVELQNLENQAKSLTSITLASGEVISNTSGEILTAFKLVGSAKPELLGNAEAMRDMTKEAIIFAQSGGMPLADAVDYLATIMEQFGAGASDTSRYINTLAAGAKVGSVEIKETSNAIQKFGAVSKSMNVSVEESVALVQTLGKTFKSGEEAGTALRNILSKLQAPENLSKEAQEDLKRYGVNMTTLSDATLPLSTRLKELSKIQGDAAAMGKVFGDENIVAGRVLLSNIPKFEELTRKVTGTSEAYTQAAAMSNNVGNQMKAAGNAAKELAVDLGQRVAPSVGVVVGAFTNLLTWIKANIETIGFLASMVTTSVATWFSYKTAIDAVSYAKDLWAKRTVVTTAVMGAWNTIVGVATGRIALATVAQQAWNTAMSLNPIGAVVAAITAAVAVYTLFSRKVNEAAEIQKKTAQITKDVTERVATESATYKAQTEILKSNTASRDAKKQAIEKLKALYPDILKKYDLEKADLKTLTTLENELNGSIQRRIATEMKAEALKDLYKQQILLQKEINTQKEFAAEQYSTVTVQSDVGTYEAQINTASERATAKVTELEAAQKKLSDEIKRTSDQYDKLGASLAGDTPPQGDTPKFKKIARKSDDDKDAEKKAKAAEKQADKLDEKLQAYKDKLQSFERDTEQLASEKAIKEEKRIKEKYDKEIQQLERLKVEQPSRKKEIDALIVDFENQKNAELSALTVKHLNEAQKLIDEAAQKAAEAEQSKEEREINTIRKKYEKELQVLKDIESGKIAATDELRNEATTKRVALESEVQRQIANVYSESLSALENFALESENKNDAIRESELQKEIVAIEAKYQRHIEAARKIENDTQNASQEERNRAHEARLALEIAQEDEITTAKDKAKRDALARIEKELNGEGANKDTKAVTDFTDPAQVETAMQAELDRLRQHYSDLLALAEQNGIDTTTLKERQRIAEAAVEKQYQEKSLKATQDANRNRVKAYETLFGELGNLATAAGELFGEEGKKTADFQKAMTLTQIGLDTAMAISSLTKHSEANPANGVTLGLAGTIQFVTGLARIVANIARAKKVLTDTPSVPQRFEGGYTDNDSRVTVRGATDGRTYRARPLRNTPTTGMLPNYPVLYPSASGGNILASERGREFLVANADLANPYIFAHVRAIEAIKSHQFATMPSVPQRYTGGYTDNDTATPQQSNTTNNTLLINVLQRTNDLLDTLQANGIEANAMLSDDFLLRAEKRKTLLQRIAT